MKVARLHEAATPFKIDTVPVPEPTGADVLIRVRACNVVPNLRNVTHVYPTLAPFLPLPPFPAIFGLDAVGEIAAFGPDASGLTIGQRVYVNPARGCGICAKCRAGKITACTAFTFAGYFGFGPGSIKVFERYPWGGFAEYLVAPLHALVPLPDEVSDVEGTHFGYLGTSYAGLRRAQVGTDTVVLIDGATGTLGVSAVLLSLALGAPKILAVGRNRAILDELRALSPKRIAVHSLEDGPIGAWAREQTAGEGADVLIEAVGPGTPPAVTVDAFTGVGRGGRIVTIGGQGEDLVVNPGWLMSNNLSYLGSVWFTSAQGTEMAIMAQAGVLDLSAYDHVLFELERVNDAVDTAQARDRGGFTNVVVTI